MSNEVRLLELQEFWSQFTVSHSTFDSDVQSNERSIVHKRFFFLSEVPIELDNLQAFYKKQERRTKISTLNKLVAHASLTGTGLLFWTRDEKSRVISGIIDLYKVCGVVPENAADKFVIEMPDRYIYRFQASSTDERARWIETLKSLAMDSPKAKAAVVGTSEFKELLDKLENGTAFKNRPMVPEEVLSDDEATGSPLAPNTETGDASKADRPKDAKRTSVLGYLPFMKERLSKDDAAKPTPVVKDDTNAVSEA